MDATPGTLLPLLVAQLAAGSRGVLDEIAEAREVVLVPLEAAPMDAGEHVLEVHTPDVSGALLYFAEPAGEPTAQGFPLRLRPYGVERPPSKPSTREPYRVSTVDGLWTSPHLSAQHAAAIAGRPRNVSPDSIIGRQLAGGKLIIQELIGRGAIGAVYKATHRELQKVVAVKVLHETYQRDLDFSTHFHAEALAASRLDHPNIVRVVDYGQEPDGLLYLSMEYLAGTELQQALDKNGPLTADRAIEIMSQVCAGLWHAHARGVIHRDIKPANIVLVATHDDDGNPVEAVKICDFGLAVLRADGEAHRAAGTPAYMSPEQCRGEQIDGRTDVYACGVTLYELITGKLPFSGDAVKVIQMQLKAPPLAPSKIKADVDKDLERIIMKALQKSPEDRQQNMRALRADLRSLAKRDGSPQSTRMPTPSAQMVVATTAQGVIGSEWLETNGRYGDFFTTMAGTSTDANVQKESEGLVAKLTAKAQATVAQITDPQNDAVFVRDAALIEAALKTIALRGDAQTLWTAVCALVPVAQDRTNEQKRRAAESIVRSLQDPNMLAAIVDQLLTSRTEPSQAAIGLITWARTAGAHALYTARAKAGPQPHVRARFVSAMRFVGPTALPMLLAALERHQPNTQGQLDVALAEDLLRSMPQIHDDAAGILVAKYVRTGVPSICKIAIPELVALWGERVRPLLLGVLQFPDDTVRMSALEGLRKLGNIDAPTLHKLEGILFGTVSTSEELREIAANAAAHATPDAYAVAANMLAKALVQRITAARTPRPGGKLEAPRIAVALGRALMTVGGREARALVVDLTEKSPEPLRTELRNMLG